MDFKDWLAKAKIEDTELSDFITKLEPFFSETSFIGITFERRVNAGLDKIDLEVDELLNPVSDAENK